MYETRLEAYKNNLKFVWTKNGKIFVRKDKDTKAVIRINKNSDIITKLTLRANNTGSENKNLEYNQEEETLN